MSVDPLSNLRQSIDYLDSALMFLLAERCHVIVEVCQVKKIQQLPLNYSEQREKDLQETFAIAVDLPLHIEFIHAFFELLYTFGLKHVAKDCAQRPSVDEQPQQQTTLYLRQLADLRASILHIDVSLCHILAERFRIVRFIGRYKKQHGMAPYSKGRWELVLEHKIQLAAQLGINVEFTQQLFNMIHEEALRIESQP